MENPYHGLPDSAFWRRSVSRVPAEEFDPVTAAPFTIAQSDKVATAGSCFAQHISRTLMKEGFNYLVTETAPQTEGAVNQNYGVFPARFGNLYTVRQLLQLFQRAYGLFEPTDRVWRRPDGKYVDPFRPQIQDPGFDTTERLEEDRETHLAAVQAMFEDCDVFIFTLGLTEGWVSQVDGAVFPLASGVVAAGEGEYAFKNFSVAEMTSDLAEFIRHLKAVNPTVRLIFTVSPVPLIATYEPRHVLVSTVYSKSALRVVAEQAVQTFENAVYFPSYEIITGPQARSRFYGEDLREVAPEGVAHVMSIFRRHYLDGTGQSVPSSQAPRTDFRSTQEREEEMQVICDEEALDG
ncbi:MAG TPA: GSCFA domain-containing protein [Rhizomicrobium sp.]|jgi:hypothetical protein